MTKKTQARHVGLASLFLSILPVIAILGFLGWLGLTGASLREEMRQENQRAVRLAELRGTISYLKEWLTTSARMAAMSGDARWIDRYNEVGPQLDVAIAEAVHLATPEVSAALKSTTDEANQDLVKMERASLALSAAGDRKAALALLDGPEFSYLESTYDTGMDAFGQDLMTLAAERTTRLNDHTWIETLGLALIAVGVVAASLIFVGTSRLRSALARTKAATRTDSLTGLSNRRHFREEVTELLGTTVCEGREIALVLVDLQRFKTINDMHGHTAGDFVLQLVAARLRSVARAGDLLARVGGDEFALMILVEPAESHSPTRDIAACIARRIIDALEETFTLDGKSGVQVGIRIGLALREASDDADSLISHADIALHEAKAESGCQFRFFDPQMDVRVKVRARLEHDVRQAIAQEDIVPFFQPQVRAGSRELIGFEVLARWPHATRGMVSPVDFIPVVEDIGLIKPMSESLLRRACRVAANWPPHIIVAFNVSPVQLRDDDLLGIVSSALEDTGLPPHRLEIEITESALVADFDLARRVLLDLKMLGVRLALDDFGTGYSSLRHLQLLPFNTLKIDASFVSVMAHDEESRKIAAAVVGLGQSLGLTIVAEGVEEAETATLLESMNCDVGQGWLYGRPGPSDDADARCASAFAKTNSEQCLTAA